MESILVEDPLPGRRSASDEPRICCDGRNHGTDRSPRQLGYELQRTGYRKHGGPCAVWDTCAEEGMVGAVDERRDSEFVQHDREGG